MEQIIGTAGCAALGFLSGAAGVGLVVLAHKTVVEPGLRLLSPVRERWLSGRGLAGASERQAFG